MSDIDWNDPESVLAAACPGWTTRGIGNEAGWFYWMENEHGMNLTPPLRGFTSRSELLQAAMLRPPVQAFIAANKPKPDSHLGAVDA